jgi:tetratricopeptide (TPR) repeat protein
VVKLLILIFFLLQSSIVLAMTQQDREEIKYWKSEFRRNKKDNVALFNLATAYFYAGKYKEAVKFYARLSRRKSKLKNEALYYLAVTLIEINREQKAYKIFQRLEKKRIPQELKVKVQEYLALFEGRDPNEPGEQGLGFFDRFSFSAEASYGQHSNPSYAGEGSETESSSTIANLYMGVKAFEMESFALDTYINHYQEQYGDLNTANSTTRDIGANFYYYLKKGYIQITPYLSSDSDVDSDTYTRKGGNLSYALNQEDVLTLTSYETTTDDDDLVYFTGTTLEVSYTNLFSERKDEFRFTTFKLFKNDLNDADDYYNSNRGVDISTGLTRYFDKGSVTGSLKFTYKEYVLDETLGLGRCDKTWTLSARYNYPLNKYFGLILDGSYMQNGSNWADIEDYDPTYKVQSYSLGITGSL